MTSGYWLKFPLLLLNNYTVCYMFIIILIILYCWYLLLDWCATFSLKTYDKKYSILFSIQSILKSWFNMDNADLSLHLFSDKFSLHFKWTSNIKRPILPLTPGYCYLDLLLSFLFKIFTYIQCTLVHDKNILTEDIVNTWNASSLVLE